MAEETLFSGESKNIEYKVAVPDKSEKYMKTVVAFANGRGGKIVFGIEDKTLEVVGMDEDSIYKTMDAITNVLFQILANLQSDRMWRCRRLRIRQ